MLGGGVMGCGEGEGEGEGEGRSLTFLMLQWTEDPQRFPAGVRRGK